MWADSILCRLNTGAENRAVAEIRILETERDGESYKDEITQIREKTD